MTPAVFRERSSASISGRLGCKWAVLPGSSSALSMVITIYSYFTGMLREFNFTEGSRVRFGQLNISSKARDVKLAKTDEGTRGEVKFLDIREK